jgi:acyl carrier protein
VVSLVTAIEEEFGCTFEDDELNADVFATIGSLTKVTEQKLA